MIRHCLAVVPLIMEWFDKNEVAKEPAGYLFWPTHPGSREVPDFVREYNERISRENAERMKRP